MNCSLVNYITKREVLRRNTRLGRQNKKPSDGSVTPKFSNGQRKSGIDPAAPRFSIRCQTTRSETAAPIDKPLNRTNMTLTNQGTAPRESQKPISRRKCAETRKHHVKWYSLLRITSKYPNVSWTSKFSGVWSPRRISDSDLKCRMWHYSVVGAGCYTGCS
jgi:hypothetical protein